MSQMLGLSAEQSETLRDAVEQAKSHPLLMPRLNALYADVQAQIDLRKPRCDISGRCCRFDEYGHKLFVTTLELAGFVAQTAAANAPTPGRCPYQIDGLCSVHQIRPFGCRIYFCDPTAQEWQQNQYEIFHMKIKQLHDELRVKYLYVEWLEALRVLR